MSSECRDRAPQQLGRLGGAPLLDRQDGERVAARSKILTKKHGLVAGCPIDVPTVNELPAGNAQLSRGVRRFAAQHGGKEVWVVIYFS